PDPAQPGKWVRDPFPQNIIPKNRIDPIASSYAQRFLPEPNLPGLPANLVNTKAGENASDQFPVRIDHKINENHTLFGPFSGVASRALRPGPLPAVNNTVGNYFRNVVLNGTHVLSHSTTLDFKLGYHRNNLRVADSAPEGFSGASEFLA